MLGKGNLTKLHYLPIKDNSCELLWDGAFVLLWREGKVLAGTRGFCFG